MKKYKILWVMENHKYRFFLLPPSSRSTSSDDAVNSRTFDTHAEANAYAIGLSDSKMTLALRRAIATKQREVAQERCRELCDWIFSKDSPYAPHERTAGYKSFVKSDVEPLLEVAKLFAAGKYSEASSVNMDTAVRENIIEPIWEVINS